MGRQQYVDVIVYHPYFKDSGSFLNRDASKEPAEELGNIRRKHRYAVIGRPHKVIVESMMHPSRMGQSSKLSVTILPHTYLRKRGGSL
jgi:hypothetical protein